MCDCQCCLVPSTAGSPDLYGTDMPSACLGNFLVGNTRRQRLRTGCHCLLSAGGCRLKLTRSVTQQRQLGQASGMHSGRSPAGHMLPPNNPNHVKTCKAAAIRPHQQQCCTLLPQCSQKSRKLMRGSKFLSRERPRPRPRPRLPRPRPLRPPPPRLTKVRPCLTSLSSLSNSSQLMQPV